MTASWVSAMLRQWHVINVYNGIKNSLFFTAGVPLTSLITDEVCRRIVSVACSSLGTGISTPASTLSNSSKEVFQWILIKLAAQYVALLTLKVRSLSSRSTLQHTSEYVNT